MANCAPRHPAAKQPDKGEEGPTQLGVRDYGRPWGREDQLARPRVAAPPLAKPLILPALGSPSTSLLGEDSFYFLGLGTENLCLACRPQRSQVDSHLLNRLPMASKREALSSAGQHALARTCLVELWGNSLSVLPYLLFRGPVPEEHSSLTLARPS